VGEPEGKRKLGERRLNLDDNIRVDLKYIG
jgi:hypothetical protein